MAALAVVLGLALGAAEFFCTALLVREVLGTIRVSRVVWVTLGKLAVYAGGVVLAVTWLYPYLLPYGLGFGLGMLASAGVHFFLERK